MIKKIVIDKFKSINHLEITPAGNFNVLIGENNIGKTTIFEAIHLWKMCYDNNLKKDKSGFYSTAHHLKFESMEFIRAYHDEDLFPIGCSGKDAKCAVTLVIEYNGQSYNYEKLVKGYTEKQWGRDCKELPAFIIKRLPVRLTFDNNYFNALYQGIPVGGYTKMVENMLAGIEVILNEDYLADKEKWDVMAEKVVYTGNIDAYFDYCLGNLEYRSVRFENEILDMPNFQGNAAVNYTDRETSWTRIIEHKWFEFGKDEDGNDLPKTIISREFSSEWKPGDEPYYPVNDEKNGELYKKYRALADKEEKIIFGGRLGEYKYYDMDAVIASALAMAERELR